MLHQVRKFLPGRRPHVTLNEHPAGKADKRPRAAYRAAALACPGEWRGRWAGWFYLTRNSKSVVAPQIVRPPSRAAFAIPTPARQAGTRLFCRNFVVVGSLLRLHLGDLLDRRSKPDLRSVAARLSPTNFFSSCVRVSTLPRLSLPERRFTLDRFLIAMALFPNSVEGLAG